MTMRLRPSHTVPSSPPEDAAQRRAPTAASALAAAYALGRERLVGEQPLGPPQQDHRVELQVAAHAVHLGTAPARLFGPTEM